MGENRESALFNMRLPHDRYCHEGGGLPRAIDRLDPTGTAVRLLTETPNEALTQE